jgi:hypothetical protein
MVTDSFSEISEGADIDIIEYRDSDAEINRCDLSDSGGNSDGGQANANVDSGCDGGDVVMMKTTIIQTRFSGTKMTMIYVRYHFLPHPVINHLKTDKCQFLDMNCFCYF